MMTPDKEMAIRKITEMPRESVAKVLVFMAGMEAGRVIDEKDEQKNDAICQDA